jgi:hypothetical protein
MKIQSKQSHDFRTRLRAFHCGCEDVERPVPSIIGNGLALPFFPCVPKMIGRFIRHEQVGKAFPEQQMVWCDIPDCLALEVAGFCSLHPACYDIHGVKNKLLDG